MSTEEESAFCMTSDTNGPKIMPRAVLKWAQIIKEKESSGFGSINEEWKAFPCKSGDMVIVGADYSRPLGIVERDPDEKGVFVMLGGSGCHIKWGNIVPAKQYSSKFIKALDERRMDDAASMLKNPNELFYPPEYKEESRRKIAYNKHSDTRTLRGWAKFIDEQSTTIHRPEVSRKRQLVEEAITQYEDIEKEAEELPLELDRLNNHVFFLFYNNPTVFQWLCQNISDTIVRKYSLLRSPGKAIGFYMCVLHEEPNTLFEYLADRGKWKNYMECLRQTKESYGFDLVRREFGRMDIGVLINVMGFRGRSGPLTEEEQKKFASLDYKYRDLQMERFVAMDLDSPLVAPYSRQTSDINSVCSMIKSNPKELLAEEFIVWN